MRFIKHVAVLLQVRVMHKYGMYINFLDGHCVSGTNRLAQMENFRRANKMPSILDVHLHTHQTLFIPFHNGKLVNKANIFTRSELFRESSTKHAMHSLLWQG